MHPAAELAAKGFLDVSAVLRGQCQRAIAALSQPQLAAPDLDRADGLGCALKPITRARLLRRVFLLEDQSLVSLLESIVREILNSNRGARAPKRGDMHLQVR